MIKNKLNFYFVFHTRNSCVENSSAGLFRKLKFCRKKSLKVVTSSPRNKHKPKNFWNKKSGKIWVKWSG